MVEIRIHTPDSDDARIRFAMPGLQVCKSIFWHDGTQPFPKPVRGASCFILNINGRHIAITAGHVIDRFREAKQANPNIIAQLMHKEIDLESSLISQSRTRDIATLALPSEFLDEVLLPGVLHYNAWPLPPPQRGAPTMFVGFPESMRKSDDPTNVQFVAWAGLDFVEDVTSREIIMAYDPARTVSMLNDTSLPPPTFNLSGCSGGPALIFENRGNHLEIYASGVITDGPNDASSGAFAEIAVIHAARLDCILADGTIPED
jgi:hypothetical protein